ncbi:pyridoxal-dependent decarboxylase [Synechococcus sp. CCY9201]|nr:pyridoxal-dependent decarboxylase [Synechococcus sp. CCY9201]MEA5473128.1 pyridoxal-dependent decarboxylase [Synechococcus sp. CCY9201]
MGDLDRPPLASAPPALRAASPLPFADPAQPDAALESFLHRAASQLTVWMGSSLARSPLPGLSVLPSAVPEAFGLPSEALLADLQQLMDGAYNPHHPGALAHLDPPPLAASIVGDLICAGLNNNLLAEELSPSLSRLERSLCSWLAEAIGLPAGAGGIPASGGSLSNLMALVLARHRAGLACCGQAVVLCSQDAHVSLAKALTVMGLPATALLTLPTDASGGLAIEALESRLKTLRTQGVPVLAVVATAGTTVRGAVDPLESVADLCRPQGIWLHVDGAIGGVYALSDRHRHRVAGLAQADSITLNPQKLLGITKTSSLLLLADPAGLEEVFGTGLPYMEPSWGGSHGGEAGLQGTRPAEILKLWLGLRQLGLAGIEAVLDGAIERRRHLRQLLASGDRLDLKDGQLHLLAFCPAGYDAEQATHWSAETRQRLLAEQLMLSRPLYGGRHHLKAVLGNPHTRAEHLERLAQLVHASLLPQL